jgi:predicted TIM-barrel fold metal-dependent hydrolase
MESNQKSTIVNQWIDVHAHFTPPLTKEEEQARWEAMRAACFMAPEPYHWAVEDTIAYMDSTGIAMQMLSNIPNSLDALQASNNYGASLVSQYPSRFGLLAALPTDNPEAALAEIKRATTDLKTDGFAISCLYNGIYLGDASLDPVWAELDRLKAVVFAHPSAFAPASLGRPIPLIEVTFETARTFVDMLYAGVFRKFPNIKFVVAHCGGALPALSGRVMALGNEAWVPNPNQITRKEMQEQLSRLYLDTAAMATPQSLGPALVMTTPDHLLYGADSGVPCTDAKTLEANIVSLRNYQGLASEQIEKIGRNALILFPKAAKRLEEFS